jgi:hypothetical protein
MSLLNILLENLNLTNESEFEIFDMDYDGQPTEELESYLEENNLDYYDDIIPQIDNIQSTKEINILRGKEIASIIIDILQHKVAGVLWTEIDGNSFSFDIIINKEFRGKNLSHSLIDRAIENYNNIKDDYGKKFSIVLDVVNPKMKGLLKTKYNFKVVKEIDGHIIMRLK